MYLENDTEKQLARADAATAAIRMNRAALARFDIAEINCDLRKWVFFSIKTGVKLLHNQN